MKEYDSGPYSLELIQFFGWYPDARFSRLAILHALSAGGEKRYIEKALSELVDRGVVKTYSENETPFYSLSDDAATRKMATQLARLEWGEWQGVLRRIHPSLGNAVN